MIVIRNKLAQCFIVNLKDGKNIELLSKGTANISEKDLSSDHVQTLIRKGIISVLQKKEEEKKAKIQKKKPEEKKQKSLKKKESEETVEKTGSEKKEQ